MATLAKGTLLPEELVSDMINKVSGHSAIARLSGQKAIPFAGEKIFTFALDKEVDIVAENGAKTVGGGTVSAISIVPIKMEYSMRTSDEFMYASDEYKLNVLQQFADGASKKFARGIDIAAFHGVNPRTNAASTVVGNNYFDKAITNTVVYTAATPDDNLEAAIALITGADKDFNGIAMSPTMASAMATVKANGVTQYPEFRFGGHPATFAGLGLDINSTVSKKATGATETDHAIVGDFANMFRWGYSKEIPLEVIQYGNPDNDADAGDLKGHNQVLLRMETYLGWGILDAGSFARIIVTD